ncbi:MAG: phosphatidate cytidylyltransferase [Gemmatimonadota bacterium]|nr:MAG: phosphatidate cytidylyltransferase [Gemmatimonadota bacterium]
MGTFLRVLSGFVFVPLLIWLSRHGGAFFLFLVLNIIVVGLWEFYRLMEAKGVEPSKKLGITAALTVATLVYWGGATHFLGMFLALFVMTITLRELFRPVERFPIYDIATTAFGVLYVGWLAIHLLLLRELPREVGVDYLWGSHFLLYAFLMTWSCDTGAYFLGRAFGRHRLLERVSPKKSVEGAVAGFLASVGAGILGPLWFVQDANGVALLTLPQSALLGALVGIFGQLGDLVESLLKRDAHIKDTSDTIPGHGGILDRFDSLFFTAPVTYYFLLLAVFR